MDTTSTSRDELATNPKRKASETTSSSSHLVSKVFRSESKSLPFGIANVLQSSTEPLKSSSTSSTSSPPSINPWLIALQQLTQSSSSTNALANASNWCAKCSIQFRLTSELVHHIRVHHTNRRQPSFHQQVPSTPKHLSILTCPICDETFRERHHLTRHMTSHR